MPIYPAAMSTVAQPLMPPGRWHPARVTAAVLCFVALVLVISSSFLPLYSGELDLGFDSTKVTITPWTAEFDEDVSDGLNGVPRVGYPMVFAAVFLACAAAACWYAATPTARAVAGRVAGLVTSVVTAFLIGTTWTTALLVGNGVDYIRLLGTLNDELSTDASYLVGYWLLLTSCLLAFAAAVLALVPARRAPVWQQPPAQVNPFVATPPFGFALPAQAPPAGRPALMVDPLTGQPVSHGPQQPPPGAVDPLTGRPLTWADTRGQASPPGGVPVVYALPPEPPPVDPGQQPPPEPVPTFGQPSQAPVDPFTGQPPVPGPIDPVTGQPLVPNSPFGGQQVGVPLQEPVVLDPLTGQPPVPGPIDPVTGQPLVPGAVDPVTGQPLPNSPVGGQQVGVPLQVPLAVDPLTGQPLPSGQVVPVSPPTGIPAAPMAQPFTAEPVGVANGVPPLAGTEPPPIVLPDAPPLPERLPGPAIPATEDPLAEPPRP